jgi:hypothetical protein
MKFEAGNYSVMLNRQSFGQKSVSAKLSGTLRDTPTDITDWGRGNGGVGANGTEMFKLHTYSSKNVKEFSN